MDYNFIIVIPTYGRNTLLERTLKSLSECTFPESYVKTIVIENGPKEEAESICKKYSSISCEYMYTSVANKSNALNLALETLDDDFFIILFDDDVRVSPGTIVAYSNAFKRFGATHFYGGPFGVDYDKEPALYYKRFLPASARGWILPPNQEVTPYLIGFNWATQSGLLKKLGGFDDRFGPNSTTGATGQEHDMMLRLYRNGISPHYVPEALVWHYVPKSRSTFRWALMRKYRNGIGDGIREKTWIDGKLKNSIKISMKSLILAVLKLKRDEVIRLIFKLNYLRGVSVGLKRREKF